MKQQGSVSCCNLDGPDVSELPRLPKVIAIRPFREYAAYAAKKGCTRSRYHQVMRLLFESPIVAREVAFMLRFEYDGCNGVLLPMAYDVVAVRTAIELMGSEFCFEGDGCAIVPLLEKECWDGLTDEQLAQRIASRLNAASNMAPF